VKEYNDTPLAERAHERIAQISGLPPKPAQQLPWLVALFPESDKVKPLLKATQTPAPDVNREETRIASQPAAGTSPPGVTPASYDRR
jgi:hypothetical protein